MRGAGAHAYRPVFMTALAALPVCACNHHMSSIKAWRAFTRDVIHDFRLIFIGAGACPKWQGARREDGENASPAYAAHVGRHHISFSCIPIFTQMFAENDVSGR